MRRSIIVIALAVACGTNQKTFGGAGGAPDAPARAATSDLHQIRIAMTKLQVRQRLGNPDDITTTDDHPGTWTANTSEVWGYGTDEHRSYPRRGAVYFDTSGLVLYVFGPSGRIEPP
jgi:hypothetical protein